MKTKGPVNGVGVWEDGMESIGRGGMGNSFVWEDMEGGGFV